MSFVYVFLQWDQLVLSLHMWQLDKLLKQSNHISTYARGGQGLILVQTEFVGISIVSSSFVS